MALDLKEADWSEFDGPKDELALSIKSLLDQKREIFEDYFSIILENDQEGILKLTHLPELIEGYFPNPEGLPLFLLRLATDVDWLEEESCFRSISTQLGNYYSCLPESRSCDSSFEKSNENVDDVATSMVKDILIPSFRW
eukprot:CAMPEP_0171457574 /NCGR_PEP_ID=MMETSP0945-20130129/3603_1 /TAXON_ID=109269 /ORGANISM="Vaucheria litorea, Strain CCMP2940" /LENGTH=139 /DNA_ID=CAMNT_0011983219 /DNA_START=309 /DNA_END=725 /DNA_ORIENTATION=+